MREILNHLFNIMESFHPTMIDWIHTPSNDMSSSREELSFPTMGGPIGIGIDQGGLPGVDEDAMVSFEGKDVDAAVLLFPVAM